MKTKHVIIGISSLVALGLFLTVGWSWMLGRGPAYLKLHHELSFKLGELPHYLEKNPETMESLRKKQPEQFNALQAHVQSISENAETIASSFIQEKLFGYLLSALLVFCCLVLGLTKNLDITRFKVPDHLVWGAVVSFLFYQMSAPLITVIAKNIFSVIVTLYFLQGIGIGVHYFNVRRVSVIQKNLGMMVLLLFPLLTLGVGFSDLWINFRKHINKGAKKYESHLKRRSE